LACATEPTLPARPTPTQATTPTQVLAPSPTALASAQIQRIQPPSPNFVRPSVSRQLTKYQNPHGQWEISHPSDWTVLDSSIENPSGNQSIKWQVSRFDWPIYDVHSFAEGWLGGDARGDEKEPVVHVISGKHVQVGGYPAYLVDYLYNQGRHGSSEFRLKYRLALFLLGSEDLFKITAESDWDEWDSFESAAHEILDSFRPPPNMKKRQSSTPYPCESADKIIVSDVAGETKSGYFLSVSGSVTNSCSYPVDVRIKAAGFDKDGNIVVFGNENRYFADSADSKVRWRQMVLPSLHIDSNQTVPVKFFIQTASWSEQNVDSEKIKFVDIVAAEVIDGP
jgi:hypothetical protein